MYTQGGVYTVTVKVSDDASPAGGAVATTQAIVTGLGLRNGVLEIVGTNGNDSVSLSADNKGMLKVKSDFVADAVFSNASVREVRAYLGGKDTFDAAKDVTQSMYVNGTPYTASKGKLTLNSTTASLFSDRLGRLTTSRRQDSEVAPSATRVSRTESFVRGRYFPASIPRLCMRNAQRSACSSMSFGVGLPAPWPALVSMRISTGASPAWAACSAAANLKLVGRDHAVVVVGRS